MNVYKRSDTGVMEHLNDEAQPTLGLHTRVSAEDAATYLRENKIGAVYGYGEVGEVAPLLAASQFALTDEERERLSDTDNLAGPAWLAESRKLGDALGFVNLHTNNSENGNGDGKWYPNDAKGKVRHKGEPEMTRAEAKATGIEIG